jgi:putative pyoverdin transport system ATP-binding/permease protein
VKLIKFILTQSPRSITIAIAAGLTSGLSQAALLAVVNRALYVPSDALLTIFIALVVAAPLLRVGSNYVLASLGQKAVLQLRLGLARNILSAPLEHLEVLGAHRLLAALTDDAGSIVQAVRLVPSLLANLAIVLGGLIYLAALSWPVFFILVVCLTIGVLSYYVPMTKGTAYQKRVREEADALWSDLRDVIDGVKELKLHSGRREALLQRLDETGHRARRLNLRAMLYFQTAGGWGQVLVFGVIGLILFARPGATTADAQVLTGYVLVILYLTGPIEAILNSLSIFNGAHVALTKIDQLGMALDRLQPRPEATTAPAGAMTIPPEPQTLDLRNVVHHYRAAAGETSFTLGPIALSLRRGELVFVTGGNGSGKTTLAKILTGLYVPGSGELRVDGQLVTPAQLPDLQDRFSVIFSDFHLFDSLLGLDARGLDERAQHWLHRLQLEHKVRVEQGRFSTTALSQGQRKRLALLTAYLEDRPIYLFDEWAADQDPAFKEIFYRELLPELAARGKMVVVISHDDRYYDIAHRLLKLDYGRLVSSDRVPAPPGQPVWPPVETASIS